MGRNANSARDNVYYKARIEASKYDDRLKSREGASELLNVHPSTLSDYELGLTKRVPAEMVVLMADLYNAPELLNSYCTNECPIGCCNMHELEVNSFDRVAIKALYSLQDIEDLKDTLLNIESDGKVNDFERVQFEEVKEQLLKISIAAQELNLWSSKYLKEV